MLLIGAVRPAWPKLKLTSLPILESLAIIPVQQGYEHERWQQRFNGRRLSYATSYGGAFHGGALSQDIYLCGDGTFIQKTGQSQAYGDAWFGTYSYSSKKEKGNWSVRWADQTSHINFNFNRRGGMSASLAESEGYVFLNDTPYQVLPNDLCLKNRQRVQW